MDEKQYILKLTQIRESISSLVNELWEDTENKECFMNKDELQKQVIEDIITGYENENI
ncbi:MAG: hypothetical protein IJA10_10570 [Lachnospiraceae bacterium]|nr:hypothetical protein [Lachnospiraceae bacterium]